MARSTSMFLQSARITALAACEGVTLQLHSNLHTRYLLLLPVSSNIAFSKAAASCSSTAAAITQHLAFCQGLPKHTQLVPAHHSTALLCAAPSPSPLTCTGEVGEQHLLGFHRGEKKRKICIFLKTQTKPGVYCVLPKQYFKRKGLSHKKPGLRMAEHHRLQKSNYFSQIAK